MKSNKVFDITQPKDNWERGFAKLEYARTGLNQVGDRRILIVNDSALIDRDVPNDEHTECDDLELLERCTDCIADYYDGLQQFKEDMYRDDS